jgi:hypothetical protein
MQIDYHSYNTPDTRIEYALLRIPLLTFVPTLKLRPYHITQRCPVLKTRSRGATHLHLLVGLGGRPGDGTNQTHKLFTLDPAMAIVDVDFALACVLSASYFYSRCYEADLAR